MKKTNAVKMRVFIPQNVQDILSLADKIYQKHLSDGSNSLLSMLQDYDWSVEGPKIAIALQKHNESKQKAKDWEKSYKERDILLPAINDIVKSSRNFLTGMHRNNMKRLGDWGFVVNDNLSTNTNVTNLKMRVVIPKNPSELLSLGNSIYQKHVNDGANSPLSVLNDYDWNVVGPTIANATNLHQVAESTRNQSETLRQERDIIMPFIINIIKASRDILAGANAKNMKRLSDWGFQVDSVVRKKKKDESINKEVKDE